MLKHNVIPVMTAVVATAVWALLPAKPAAGAEPVLGFRNGGTGAFPDADPPLEWSVTKNVKWRWGSPPLGTTLSSPLLVGGPAQKGTGKIFTLARPMTLVCLDKNTGKELWRRETHLGGETPPPAGQAAVLATPKAWLPKDATERVPPANEVVLAMHAAIVRDGRIYDLSSRVPAKGRKDGVNLDGEIRGLQRLMSSKELSEEERSYFAERVKEREAILADGEANRAAYEKELAELEAQVSGQKDPVLRAIGHPTAGSPVSDGERVFALFSPGLLVCYDLDGKRQWIHAVVDAQGRQAKGSWGNYAETPQVADGKVLVSLGNVAQCIDAKSGKLLWARENRPFFAAASPAIGHSGGEYYFMLSSGVVGRLRDGQTVFTANTDSLCRYFSTAVSADGRTFSAVRDAVRLPDAPDGKPTLLWQLPESELVQKGPPYKYVYGGSHQYCAPVIHGGILYYHCTHSAHSLAALDVETGAIIYRTDPGSMPETYSDLILAGDYLFMFRGSHETKYLEGPCRIMKAGREFAVVGENRLERVVCNTPVFEGRRMYMRTMDSLFCIEKPQEK